MNKDWNLTGGVIIIGSLLWQDHLPPNKKNNIRKDWRNNHLNKEIEIMVKLPIRYGRCSKNGIYTMVFSNNRQRYKRLGTGFVYPFKSNPIKNFPQLLKEAKAMSNVEGMNGNFWGENIEIWGNMGILFNESKIAKETRINILDNWKKQLYDNKGKLKYGDFKVYENERPCITDKGRLTIKWIKPVVKRDSEQVSEFDFLIATATVPKHKNSTMKRYPKVQEIAVSVKKDTTRYYFLNNLKSGITTFQDNEILNEL